MTKKGTVFERVRNLASAALLVAGIAGLAAPDAQAQYYRRHRTQPRRVYVNPYSHYPGYTTNNLYARAQQQGYSDGYARGRYDRSIGQRTPRPQGHGAFQYGLNGWTRELGSTGIYREYYRQSFVRGYQDGFYGRR